MPSLCIRSSLSFSTGLSEKNKHLSNFIFDKHIAPSQKAWILLYQKVHWNTFFKHSYVSFYILSSPSGSSRTTNTERQAMPWPGSLGWCLLPAMLPWGLPEDLTVSFHLWGLWTYHWWAVSHSVRNSKIPLNSAAKIPYMPGRQRNGLFFLMISWLYNFALYQKSKHKHRERWDLITNVVSWRI